jgi:hypothetical protein
MAKAKARVDFSGDADDSLSGTAHGIHNLVNTNAATFGTPPVTMPAFLTTIGAWDTALAAAEMGGKDRITTKNNARQALEDDLSKLGTYVNLIADGDQATIDLSGFPSYPTKHAQGGGGVSFVPQNLRLRQGDTAGSAVARWQGDGTQAMYEVQTCTGDPNVQVNWSYRGSYSGGRAELNGLPPGSTVWARVRKIGTGGATGGWSDPAQLMVT